MPEVARDAARLYPARVSVRIPGELRIFATLRPDVEAVVQRCGAGTFDLVLIDLDGNWTREVFASQEEAEAVAGELGVPLHHGWDDDRLTRRMGMNDPWNEPGGRRRAR